MSYPISWRQSPKPFSSPIRPSPLYLAPLGLQLRAVVGGSTVFVLYLGPYQNANSSSTMKFVDYLQAQTPEGKLVLVWDGASYHPSPLVSWFSLSTPPRRELESSWSQIASVAPQENPMENIGGQLNTNAAETPSTLSVFQEHQETIWTVNWVPIIYSARFNDLWSFL